MAIMVAITFAIPGVSAYGQTAEDYEALKLTLGDEKYELLSEKKESLLDLMAYRNRHGYHVAEYGDKQLDIRPLSEINAMYPHLPEVNVALLSSGQWNLEGYHIPGDEKSERYFAIPGTSEVLVIQPRSLVEKRLEQKKK